MTVVCLPRYRQTLIRCVCTRVGVHETNYGVWVYASLVCVRVIGSVYTALVSVYAPLGLCTHLVVRVRIMGFVYTALSSVYTPLCVCVCVCLFDIFSTYPVDQSVNQPVTDSSN